MSKMVETRSADQCRSHHQKIMKYHNTIEEAIVNFSKKLNLKHMEAPETPQVKLEETDEKEDDI